MKKLNIKAFAGLIALFIVIAAALFLAAGTFDYWQAWSFLAVFFGSAFLITLYLMIKDPELLRRRTTVGPTDEKERSQKIIQFFAQFAFLLVIVFPVFDHRFGWSAVAPLVNGIGDVLIAVGFLIVFFVFKENTFTSALIEVESKQTVISSGPYALVRHPMYIGALILLLGTPLSLGSFWGVLAVVPITIVIIVRLLDEEKFLSIKLPGYAEYMSTVRYRLIPYIW
jgi:protein-S-isoprenylcysteine O-methyltransferase Ste14